MGEEQENQFGSEERAGFVLSSERFAFSEIEGAGHLFEAAIRDFENASEIFEDLNRHVLALRVMFREVQQTFIDLKKVVRPRLDMGQAAEFMIRARDIEKRLQDEEHVFEKFVSDFGEGHKGKRDGVFISFLDFLRELHHSICYIRQALEDVLSNITTHLNLPIDSSQAGTE